MRLMRLMGIMGLMGLAGCSGEHAVEPVQEPAEQTVVEPVLRPEDRPSVPVEDVMGLVSNYRVYGSKESSKGVTRAWTLPSGYESYVLGDDQSISAFFTQNDVAEIDDDYFFKSSGKWRVSKTDLEAATYYLYGFAPNDFSIKPTISPDSKYEDGAVLTLQNMPTITTNDMCVVIGAKNGKDYYNPDADYSVTGLVPGTFAYVAQPTGEGSGGTGNYVFLLFDHLYSALHFRFKVNATYNALRTIKLRELQLKTYTGPSYATCRDKTKAVITLKANDSGFNPITGVTLTQTTGKDDAYTPFYQTKEGEEGLELNASDYKDISCNFAPNDVTKLILKSTYDVYDKKGNRVRQKQEAVNSIVLKDLFFYDVNSSMPVTVTSTVRGTSYTIDLVVNPTYLYVMSDPDLDNPTFEVN